jgi:hypothetical protein
LPFDPLKKGFAFKFWGYASTCTAAAILPEMLIAAVTGFSLPFLIAGEMAVKSKYPVTVTNQISTQSGKRRRTNRCSDGQLGGAFRAVAGAGIRHCRIKERFPRTIVLHDISINFIGSVHSLWVLPW